MSKSGNWPKPVLAMIRASHSRKFMEHCRDDEPDDEVWGIFQDTCQGMLNVVPPAGSSCVIMSALLAMSLEGRLGVPVPVVAGALKLDGKYVYGSDRAFDGARVFSENGPDWDGHCWLLFGDYIVDISLGRTARQGHCSTPLAHRILSTFGQHVGLVAVRESSAREAGLQYLPRYVLTPDQVLANAGGAMQKFGL